jgi:Phospholipase_D-nuclease N-terminal
MVMMASDYPFLSIFWTMMIFVFWVIWIWLVITVLADVFRRKDLSGWGKAGWTVFVIVLPFLGVLIYLIAHGTGMSEAEAQ